jgi:hypothetical protein
LQNCVKQWRRVWHSFPPPNGMERMRKSRHATAHAVAHPSQQRALKQLGYLAKLMDAQFRVPGTDFRFGLDGILGFIPGAGDLSTFAVSGYMLWVMARNGASGFVLARMTTNILIDAVIGAIPLIGDIFDIAFKANMRNLRLMQQHYQEGRHQGSAWKAIIPVLLVLFLIIVGLIWLVYKAIYSLF